MRTYEITYFDNNESTSGAPLTVKYNAWDADEAIVQFNYNYPTRKVWSIDEIEFDFDSYYKSL